MHAKQNLSCCKVSEVVNTYDLNIYKIIILNSHLILHIRSRFCKVIELCFILDQQDHIYRHLSLQILY